MGTIPAPFYFIVFSLIFTTSSVVHAAETKMGMTNESEAGIVVTGGNAQTQSYSFRQLTQNRWTFDLLRLDAKYLKASSRGVESARSWLLGLRYERILVHALSAYAGQNVESDVFAGFQQRYNTDVGSKYYFIKEDTLYVFAEAGYRRAVENRASGQLSQSLLRIYAETNRDWSKTFSTKAGLEYLPNLTISSDYQMSFDLSANAAMSEIFALKSAYGIKYRKIPVAPATETTDTQFTTAVVAKF